MVYISSDTNVWIDFYLISKTDLPFRLPYTYIMNNDAIKDELLSPAGLGEELIRSGLVSVELTIEEFTLADSYGPQYPKLSIYDRIALAIAKNQTITLLPGDRALRNAANEEQVACIETLGILDQLLAGGYIEVEEYKYRLLEFQKINGREVRLPKTEITLRL